MKINSRGLAQALYNAVASEPKRARTISENFLAYLRLKRRRKSLPALLTHLRAIDAANNNSQDALITSALPITASAKRGIEQLIKKRTGTQKVNAQYITEPSIIGGSNIHFNDTVIDITVSSRLKTIVE